MTLEQQSAQSMRAKVIAKVAPDRQRRLPTRNSHLREHALHPTSHKHLSGTSPANLFRSVVLQPKLKISTPGDKYESEADRIADQVIRMSAPSLQRACACGGGCPRCQSSQPESAQQPLKPLRRNSRDSAAAEAPSVVQEVLRSAGRQLDQEARAFMEPRFGQDFSDLRVYSDAKAAESARAVNARAYTVGRNVVFGAGEYAPRSVDGKRLLAHELTHVIQQRSSNDGRSDLGEMNDRRMSGACAPLIRRKEDDKTPDKPKIDYGKAKIGNKQNATKLGWDTRLAEFKPSWTTLWLGDNLDTFADAVAAFQVEIGLKGKAVDGVLGRFTWDRIRPIGEVIAKQKVSWPDSASVCTIAAEERLKKGFALATGEKLVPKEEREPFRIILQSIGSRMLEVEEQYRGAGAAGALVYLGKGEFVTQGDIWDKKALKPGAAMQVWKKKSALDSLKKGEDESSMGTAFVFVEYVGDDAMNVRHFDALETHKKSEFEVWIGANLLSRSP